MKIKILIPIYNDWQSVFKLLENIDSEIAGLDVEVSVLIVNDTSTEQRPEINFNLNNLKSVQVINMKENRGHARCNAAGLKYINEKEDFDYVIPMDGDGEDRPEEIRLLIDKAKEYPDTVITGDRIERSEGLIFKFCYLTHKYLTYVFTRVSDVVITSELEESSVVMTESSNVLSSTPSYWLYVLLLMLIVIIIILFFELKKRKK